MKDKQPSVFVTYGNYFLRNLLLDFLSFPFVQSHITYISKQMPGKGDGIPLLVLRKNIAPSISRSPTSAIYFNRIGRRHDMEMIIYFEKLDYIVISVE